MLTPEEELALAALEAAQWGAMWTQNSLSPGSPCCPVCRKVREQGHNMARCPIQKALDALRAKKAVGSSPVAVDQLTFHIGHPGRGYCDLCNGECRLKC